MAFDYVPCGLYEGWTKAQVLAELAKIDAAIAARAAGSPRISAVSENGKSVQFAASVGMDMDGLTELRRNKTELRQALSFVDDSVVTIPTVQKASFTDG